VTVVKGSSNKELTTQTR